MQITIRSIGNSKGVLLPKSLLLQVGLDEDATAEVFVENGAIVLRKPIKQARAGWAQAAKEVAASGEDTLLMGEFGNEADEDLSW